MKLSEAIEALQDQMTRLGDVDLYQRGVNANGLPTRIPLDDLVVLPWGVLELFSIDPPEDKP